MSGTYEMAVTINPLVSPLLYERLAQCATARERAAVLRALAEAMLRAQLAAGGTAVAGILPPGAPIAPAGDPFHRPGPAAVTAPLAPMPPVVPAATAPTPTTGADSPAEGFRSVRVVDSEANGRADIDALGAKLAGMYD